MGCQAQTLPKGGSCRGEEPGEGADLSRSACRASCTALLAAGHRLDTVPSKLLVDLQTGTEKKVLSSPWEIYNWT